jgi:3-deoxy-manno-octulosonate cytidylyltransferase (CMP-KDO synthetase)
MMEDYVVVIPARFKSTRYPGKPLALIAGVPMIIRVAQRVMMSVPKEKILIATEDERILKTVNDAGFKGVMTADTALTGTDRVHDAVKDLDVGIIVNVQGDEPLLDSTDILKMVQIKKENPGFVINGMTRIVAGEDPRSLNLPKVVFNEKNELLYMSRAAVPGSKKPHSEYWKQVCIYAFSKDQLAAFYGMGRKSAVENIEDIEILRFLDLGIRVKMVETRPGSLAVDVPEDIPPVEAALKKAGLA